MASSMSFSSGAAGLEEGEYLDEGIYLSESVATMKMRDSFVTRSGQRVDQIMELELTKETLIGASERIETEFSDALGVKFDDKVAA